MGHLLGLGTTRGGKDQIDVTCGPGGTNHAVPWWLRGVALVQARRRQRVRVLQAGARQGWEEESQLFGGCGAGWPGFQTIGSWRSQQGGGQGSSLPPNCVN